MGNIIYLHKIGQTKTLEIHCPVLRQYTSFSTPLEKIRGSRWTGMKAMAIVSACLSPQG